MKIEKSRITVDTPAAYGIFEVVMNEKSKLREIPKAMGYLSALAAAGALGAAVILACSNPATPKPLEPTTSNPPPKPPPTPTNVSGKDFDTLRAAGNEDPIGIWSDGTTMWVTDWGDAKIYAHSMSTKARTP